MQDLSAIVHNQVLVTALVACFFAQFLKLVVEVVRHQKLNFHVLIETGGMPSSHSALVAALATGVGQTVGWSSTEFAVSTIFAIIVMYDAAGVRWAAGQQARILNQMLEGQAAQQAPEEQMERLKEMLGHTRLEVFVGSAVGVAVSLVAGVTAWVMG
ncbi:divergent PAP2 family protein [Prochlorothrix hollandica]|uniref:Acid phosphatase n=1 Tax=Prochlorothrix hollandica PCC 9006 = CALU 1027 TaxID=317619 RepID=A0A0M2PZK5_PROHO|nr:divergent PAP2 family protein [Prochlorothrix hollandica]KKJ01595.1 acid phosphatase [Prochlorothrix hollandica PCC 9006 = CALU 1027]